MKHPHAETVVNNTGQAAGLEAMLPAILPASPGFAVEGDRAFICLHSISTRQEGEL